MICRYCGKRSIWLGERRSLCPDCMSLLRKYSGIMISNIYDAEKAVGIIRKKDLWEAFMSDVVAERLCGEQEPPKILVTVPIVNLSNMGVGSTYAICRRRRR